MSGLEPDVTLLINFFCGKFKMSYIYSIGSEGTVVYLTLTNSINRY